MNILHLLKGLSLHNLLWQCKSLQCFIITQFIITEITIIMSSLHSLSLPSLLWQCLSLQCLSSGYHTGIITVFINLKFTEAVYVITMQHLFIFQCLLMENICLSTIGTGSSLHIKVILVLQQKNNNNDIRMVPISPTCLFPRI